MGGTLFHKMVAVTDNQHHTEPRQATSNVMRVEDVELSPQAVDDNFYATPFQQATGTIKFNSPTTTTIANDAII